MAKNAYFTEYRNPALEMSKIHGRRQLQVDVLSDQPASRTLGAGIVENPTLLTRVVITVYDSIKGGLHHLSLIGK